MSRHILTTDPTGWASFTFVRVRHDKPAGMSETEYARKMLHRPYGYIFVMDHYHYQENALWKLPGGGKEPVDMERPVLTAVRELRGETGLMIDESRFRPVKHWLAQSRDHFKHLFVVDISLAEAATAHTKDIENEGEEPRFFNSGDFALIVKQRKFMWAHYEMLTETALILKDTAKTAPIGNHAVATHHTA